MSRTVFDCQSPESRISVVAREFAMPPLSYLSSSFQDFLY